VTNFVGWRTDFRFQPAAVEPGIAMVVLPGRTVVEVLRRNVGDCLAAD
jgi:hypothetical protein